MAAVVIEDGASLNGRIDIIQPQGAAPPAPTVSVKLPGLPSVG